MIEQNDVSLMKLCLGPGRPRTFRCFNSSDSKDFSRLGDAIGANTHITTLVVWLQLTAVNGGFYDGLKQNTSVTELGVGGGNIVGGVYNEILKAYQENSNIHLTNISIGNCNIDNGGDVIIATTLKKYINLKQISLYQCNIPDEQLMPIVEGLRGHRMLEVLNLEGNRIGDAGCDALATLLKDPSCNLQVLKLARNNITNAGATTIANSLTHNTKLERLHLDENQIDTPSARDVFSKLLCNTSSINDTYSSNHTLKAIIGIERQGESDYRLHDLLVMNAGTNKSDVAMKKILRYHPNMDMEPLFLWDSEGEQTLKALPYVLGWFEKAEQALGAGEESGRIYNVGAKKLTAIHQFAKAMPLLIASLSSVTLFDRNVRQQFETKYAKLEARNDELEAKNAKLEARNDELEVKIAELTQKKRKRKDGAY